MAHGFWLGKAGQIKRSFAAQATKAVIADFNVRKIDAGMIAVADFKQQGFGRKQRRTGSGGSVIAGRAVGRPWVFMLMPVLP